VSPQRKAGGGSLSSRLARHMWSSVRESRLVSSHAGPAAPTRGGARTRAAEPETDHLASEEDRRQERDVLGQEGVRLGDLIIRYRRELAPLGAALAVVVVAAEGHQQAPTRWGLALLLGGLAIIAWHFRASRPAERLYGVGVGLVGSVLLGSGWALDVTHVWWWAALAGATVAGGLPWWAHVLPRGRLLLQGKRPPKTTRQQARAVVTAWPSIAEARGIGGVRLQRVEPDEYGWTMRLRIPTASKLTVRNIAGAVDGLAASFRVRVGAVRVESVRERADLAVVRVNITDPLAESVAYPGPGGTSIAEPLRLGRFEDRSEIRVTLPGTHALDAGATGAGKTALQRVALAELVARRDCVLWGIDAAKRGLGFTPFVDALDRLAIDTAGAIKMLEAVLAVQRTRAAWMGQNRVDPWPLGPERPQLVVVIDELSDLVSDSTVADLLEAVMKLGREQAISVIAGTQRASGEALGDSVTSRSQFGIRLALRCREVGDGDLILGKGRAAEGWRPDRLQAPGSMLVLTDAPEHQVPQPGRAYWLPVAEARRIAEAAAEHMAKLEAEAAAAVAEVDQAPAPKVVTAVGRRSAKPAARERVLVLLTAAGPDGVSGGDLVAALDGEVSRPTVYRVLAELQEDGIAERDNLGVWSVAGSPAAGGEG
jgi:DNA segregation ATPase FtsK/SpoIIIE, S-DNA-T family